MKLVIEVDISFPMIGPATVRDGYQSIKQEIAATLCTRMINDSNDMPINIRINDTEYPTTARIHNIEVAEHAENVNIWGCTLHPDDKRL